MNKFDSIFFARYVRDGDEPLEVCHRHIVLIIDTIIVWVFFGIIIPAFFYYNGSFGLQKLVPFLYFEGWLFLIYAILMYKIFDWYNDVWILTDKCIIDLDWSLFSRNVAYIEFGDIKGIEVSKDGFWDSTLDRGVIRLYLEGEDDPFELPWAHGPDAIVSYIQNYMDEKAKKKKQLEKQSFEVLLETLSKVVKTHLENPHKHIESESEAELEPEEVVDPDVERALKRKGTIDLRGE